MGHERVGYLPKTKKWKAIVDGIGSFSSENDNTEELAFETTKRVRKQFDAIKEDSGVFAAFKFIILLSQSSKVEDSTGFLSINGIQLERDFSLFELTNSIQDYVTKHQDSKEYSTVAIQSMIDTVSSWAKQNENQTGILFDSNPNAFEIWRKAADGAGFCEISRSFFAKFTERYLKYYLEREASSRINNLFDRTEFSAKLEEHVNEISKHAFETSKITQSFSAGWYNRYVKDKMPSTSKIKGFLSFAFQKLNSELLREEKT